MVMDDESEDIEIEDDILVVKGRFTQTTPSTISQKSQSQKPSQKLSKSQQKKQPQDEDEELIVDDLPVNTTIGSPNHFLVNNKNQSESNITLFEEAGFDYDPVVRSYALVNFNDDLILYIHPSEEDVQIDDDEEVIRDSDDDEEKSGTLIVDCLKLQIASDQLVYSFNKQNSITLTPSSPSSKGKSYVPQNCELLGAKMVFSVELGRKAPFVLYRYILQGKGVLKCVYSLAKLEIDTQAKRYSATTVQNYEINLNPQEVILADGPTVFAFDYNARVAFVSQCSLPSSEVKKTKPGKKNNNNNTSTASSQVSWVSRFLDLPPSLQKIVCETSLLNSGSWKNGPTVQLVMRASADFTRTAKTENMDIDDDDPLAEPSQHLKLELPSTSLLGPFFISLDIGNLNSPSLKSKLKAALWSEIPFDIALRAKHVQAICPPNDTKPNGFLIATNDCRLIRIQHGHVKGTALLKPALPVHMMNTGCVDNSLNVVAIVCKLLSGSQSVKLFDSTSLQLVQEFSGRGDVLVGDFMNAGHDMLLLIDSQVSSKHSIDFLTSSSLVTDLTLTLANKKVTQAKTLAGKENLQSVALSLEARTQAALKELTSMEWNIQQKEKLLQNCFQLLQCMVADPFPRDPVAVPKIQDVVPLFKPIQLPQTKTALADDLVKKQKPYLFVEKLIQSIFGKKLGVSLMVKNISKNEVLITNAFLVGDHYRLETTSIGEGIGMAPEEQHTIYASCDLPHSMQRSTLSFSLICGFRLKKNANEAAIRDLQPSQLSQSQMTQQNLVREKLENSTKYQIVGTVVVTPQMYLGIANGGSKEPVFLTSIDLALLASPEWKPQDIVASFSKALHLRTLVQQDSNQNEFELGCAERDRAPLGATATCYNNYVEVTLKAIDQSDLAKAIQVLQEQLHPAISMQFNIISWKVLGIISDFQQALTAEFKFLEKWRDTFHASRDTSIAVQQLLQFKRDYMTHQIQTDQLFARLVSVMKD